MYNNPRNTNRNDVMSFIDGNDIYNSKLIKRMNDLEITLKTVYTDKSMTRTDLISKKFYNKPENESFLYLLNHDIDSNSSSVNIIENFDTLFNEVNV